MKQNQGTYDLIIIGGGLAATFLSLSIFKLNPTFRILILEKSEAFPQKIGESLVDLTALYVQSLNIEHILEKHSIKTGVRFLFHESKDADLLQIVEFASPTYPGLIKGYHLDRRLFDQQMLEDAEQKGATVFRPAEIRAASFETFHNELEVEVEGQIHHVQARWVVDATGRSRFIPKQLNWQDKSIQLNTGAIMAHFTDIAPEEVWDTPPNEHWDSRAVGPRAFSTTHLMRDHAWWWIIRLDETTTSIGMVFDKGYHQFENFEQFFVEQIQADAQLSLMTRDAERGKIRYVERVPYVCERLFSKGIALIGESGAFLDPFVSPGIEMIGQQTIWLAELLTREKASGRFDAAAWTKYSQTFHHAYDSRLQIYEAAYPYMHSYDIFSAWLAQGNYMYFGRVVYPAILFPGRLKQPLRFHLIDRLALSYFTRRFSQIIEKRRKENRISLTQANETQYSGVRVPKNLLFPFMPLYLLGRALWLYLKLEWTELKARFSPNSKRLF